MRLALVRGLVALSAQLGVTHWCAVMEPSLLRLLRATSIFFENFGPPVEYHGLRQPCYNGVGDILDRVAEDRPLLWQFLTANGALWDRRAMTRQSQSRLITA
jgi:N-acyl amino acid synthase of PEP-CTERM/exosortase system